MRFAFLFLAVAALSIGCKKKDPPFDAQFAAGLTQNGVVVPIATGATVPVPREGMMVLIRRDKVAVDSPARFAIVPQPLEVFAFDPARAASVGADAKYKRTVTDPLIVPLANITSEYVAKGTKTAMIAAPEAPPLKLYEEIRSTLAAGGVTEHYRLVRSSDGTIVAELLPAR